MLEIKNKNECCGCSACYSICPKNAISMVSDEEGFLYPQVNESLCVKCGLCNTVCPYITKKRPEKDLESTFVAVNKNEEQRSISSSGGMFLALATCIIEKDGVVFGAAYDDNWCAIHKYVDNDTDLLRLVGSKYMQSNLGDSFNTIKALLRNNKLVLFVGTTCQVNGLINFLGKDYENLFTVDFICLGVPSPMIWRDYLKTYFKDYEINYINFKDKSLGWHTFSLDIQGKKKRFVRNGRETYYFTGYFRHLYTRPSCSNCTYKLGNRCSDITISDCWGYNKIAPEMDDNKGMSSVVCHSEKGLNFFNSVKAGLKWKKGEFTDVLKYNPGYRLSSEQGNNREAFWSDYRTMHKDRLFKKYCKPASTNIFRRIASKVKSVIMSGSKVS